MKILAVTWRTGVSGCIGVVAVERVDGWKAYMARVAGISESADIQHVANLGAPLMESEARGFFPQLIETPYTY